jgi:two-component system phosphate regulon sensor histidine kinase PhoR
MSDYQNKSENIQEKMQELDELKNTFVALVSHELRTPLNLISGYLTLTLEELEKDPETARKYLEIVEKNTHKLTRVVQELTDFTRLQLGKEITYLNPIPIGEAFIQTYELLKPNLKKKNINLIAELPREIQNMRYDGESLIILFKNLLSNAAKFSPAGGKVQVTGVGEGEQVVISIHDWAKPIPEDKRETIFEDFRQLENYLTRRYEGMGLGLAVARRTALFLGGNIELTVRNDGNTFTVVLPRQSTKD